MPFCHSARAFDREVKDPAPRTGHYKAMTCLKTGNLEENVHLLAGDSVLGVNVFKLPMRNTDQKHNRYEKQRSAFSSNM